jgi:hypothetical protein
MPDGGVIEETGLMRERLTFWACMSLLIIAPVRAGAPEDCLHDLDDIYEALGVHVVPADVAVGQLYWELVDFAACDPFIGGGKVNIFFKALDQSGQHITGQWCTADWGSGFNVIQTKPPPDWGDINMSGNWCPTWPEVHGPYSAWVNDYPSDVAAGMGLPCNHHWSFYCTWQLKQKQAPMSGDINGTVTTAATGDPIRYATVIADPGNHSTTTALDGTYDLRDLPPGMYTVTAEATGYFSVTRTNQVVQLGQTTTVDFALTASRGIVNGSVTAAESSDPIAGAFLTVAGTGYTAVSDGNGDYEIRNVPAGTHQVACYAPARIEKQSQVEVSTGSLMTRDFALAPEPGRVAHILFDFNDDYYTHAIFHRISNSLKPWWTNQRWDQETAADRRLWPHTGTDSAQGFYYSINDDNTATGLLSSDPVSGHEDVDLQRVAQTRGWEPISSSHPIVYHVYVRGVNGADDPDDPGQLWQMEFGIKYPELRSVFHNWTGANNGSWQLLRLEQAGLYGGQNQRLHFGVHFPMYYGALTSWMVWENVALEYSPTGTGDVTPPAPVQNFSAVSTATRIQLTWTNPSTSDYEGVRIRYRTDQFPTDVFDGEHLADVPGEPHASGSYRHADFIPEETYYYRAFAYDEVPNYSVEPVTAWATAPLSRQPGDFDGDNDVDQTDFGHFQACLTGSGTAQGDPGCVGARMDNDPDVDHDDFGLFQACFSGPGIPGDPSCAD